MSIRDDALIVAGGVVLIGLAVWYAKRQVTELGGAAIDWAADHVQYVDPTDPRNVVYSGVSGVGAAVSGDKDWTLGGWIYDITH